MTETSNLLVDDDSFIGDYSAPKRILFAAETAEQPIKNIIFAALLHNVDFNFLVLQGPN